MINAIVLFVLFIGATVLHWACATVFASLGIHVSVMLVFVVALCATLKPEYGYPSAFLCGLFLDFFGAKLFGNNAMTFSLMAAIVYALGRRFDFESAVSQMLTVFGLSLFASLCNLLLLSLFASAAVWQGFWSLLGGSVVNALGAPLMFWVLRKTLSKGFMGQTGV